MRCFAVRVERLVIRQQMLRHIASFQQFGTTIAMARSEPRGIQDTASVCGLNEPGPPILNRVAGHKTRLAYRQVETGEPEGSLVKARPSSAHDAQAKRRRLSAGACSTCSGRQSGVSATSQTRANNSREIGLGQARGANRASWA